MKWYWKIVICIAIIIIVFLIGCFDIQSIKSSFCITIYKNINFLVSFLYRMVPIIIIFLLLILLFANKWAFRVDRLNIGGFNIIFDNPNNLFKRQIRTYLDTKRTLFKIDLQHDNFNEVLDSYFEIYKHIRDEMKILGEIKGTTIKRNKEKVELYKIANTSIRHLNHFLTNNQSNFRRWYKYVEKNMEQDFYLKDIGELQKEYKLYEQMSKGFSEINSFFSDTFAPVFNIDTKKWS